VLTGLAHPGEMLIFVTGSGWEDNAVESHTSSVKGEKVVNPKEGTLKSKSMKYILRGSITIWTTF
jgi:hypothetical protein